MKLQRNFVTLVGPTPHGNIVLQEGSTDLTLTADELRWLCLVAGPALLNELGKEAADGND
jgi:hypothetical protein